ncbi:MAG: nitronate monooxygenase [Solirubrobacteraceae bacterium]|nr:nitronate monooxygenase [Solirubrobacteraceae bacterium]
MSVTRLFGIEHAVVQGPFGGGLSSVELAGVVSDAGGLGSFGAHHLEPAAITEVIGQLRARTSRPFNVNLWVDNHDADDAWLASDAFDAHVAALTPWFDELGVTPPQRPDHVVIPFIDQAAAVLDAAPPVFSFVFGVPDDGLLVACRERGIVTVGTATTVDEAVALDDAGVDAIVATGFEAGGHRVSWLRSAESSLTGTMALVPQVADAVSVPVIAAGGIADARGVAAAHALGADAVQVGTAFLATRESNTTDAHRALLGTPESAHTVLTRAFTGRLARGFPNRLQAELEASATGPAPYPFQHWLLGHLREEIVRQERTDLIALWAGQAAPLARLRSAADVFAALVASPHRA